MYFYEIEINASDTDNDLATLKRSDIDCYMLALLKVDINGCINVECSSLYYVIDSNCNKLSEEMGFISPRSPGCTY